MARDSSGNYTLPSGNPVVGGTTILDTWANPTMSDLGTEIQDSLNRSGKGGMLAGLKGYAGTVSSPGYAWSTETASGFYLKSANNIGMAIAGVQLLNYTTEVVTISSAVADATVGPILKLHRDSASPADADFLGAVYFDGEDSSSAIKTYGSIESQADDVTAGTEDGTLLVKTMVAGTLTTMMDISSAGLVMSYTPIVTSTDAGAGAGPTLKLLRDSSSPADADLIGQILFNGDDSGGAETVYASIDSQIDDVTGGTEDGTLLIKTMQAGTLTTAIDISTTVVITPNTTVSNVLTYGSLSDGSITITAFVDEDDMASNSATLVPTQQSVKAYVDTNAITLTNEQVQDVVGGMLTGNTETGITVTYEDGDGTIDFVVGTLNQDTTGTAAIATTVTITDNENTNENNAIIFTSGGDLDGGNLGLESDGDLHYNPSTGLLTATSFAGALTGNVTGNASGTAATVTGAAQSNITSLGTLTTLTVDNVIINGTTIGHTGDTDLITLASGIATVAGEVSMTTLDIGGTNVTATAAELNKLASAGTLKQAGKETIWVPAAAMYPTTTNGCSALAQVETTAQRPELKCLDFDAGTAEYAQFAIAFPKSWNLGVVQFQAFWSPSNTNTDNAIIGLQGLACTEGDTADAVFGTAVEVTDAGIGTIEDVQMTAVSGDITIAGSPADDDMCFFQVYRDAADGSDTFSGEVRLLGIKLFFTTDAANDA